MKRNFTNENFEDFLRQSAEGLRMRPSDKVWKGIAKVLNKRRRRYGLVVGSFLLASLMLSYWFIENSSPFISAPAKVPSVSAGSTTAPAADALHPARVNTIATGKKVPVVIGSTFIQNRKVSSGPISAFYGEALPEGAALSSNTSQNELGPVAKDAVNDFTPTVVDDYFTESNVNHQENTVQPDKPVFPLSIESVLNSYRPRHLKKLKWQFYFTPTVSYRKLSENKSFLRTETPTNPNYALALLFDVNNMVTHKPDLGFEVGTAVKFGLTRNMKLRAGLQLNVNRYDIKAYNTSTSVATIMFNGRTSARDSQNVYTRYSNTPSYRANWLENYYVQISTPVGAEFKIAGREKTYWGAAATIQPTYVLGDRAYLISSNYKNYAEVPQLVRRWNVNTAVETFVNYSTGRISWQVGPQVRYQLLSSFIDKYPVKENLFDFGLKIGLSIEK